MYKLDVQEILDGLIPNIRGTGRIRVELNVGLNETAKQSISKKELVKMTRKFKSKRGVCRAYIRLGHNMLKFVLS